jgi:hypothetical protein
MLLKKLPATKRFGHRFGERSVGFTTLLAQVHTWFPFSASLLALPAHHLTSLFIFVTLLSFGAHAQSTPAAREVPFGEQHVREQAVMARATLVFEGKLVRTAGYFTADSSRVFRTSVIRLTHLFKGALAPGTVQVVYKGPVVAGRSKDPKTGELWIQVSDDNGHGQADNQGTTLPSNKPILFFCRPLPAGFAPKPPQFAADDAPALEVVGVAFDLLRNYSVLSDVGGRFPDFPALHQYLEANYRLQQQW